MVYRPKALKNYSPETVEILRILQGTENLDEIKARVGDYLQNLEASKLPSVYQQFLDMRVKQQPYMKARSERLLLIMKEEFPECKVRRTNA